MTGNDCSVLEQSIQFPPHLRLRFWGAWLSIRFRLCKERSMNEWIREILKNYQGSKLIQAFFRPLLLILSNIKGKVSIDEKTSTDIVVYACLHLASAWMQQQPIPMFAQQSVAGWAVGGGNMEMRDISFCNENNWPSLISSKVHVARAFVATRVSTRSSKDEW